MARHWSMPSFIVILRQSAMCSGERKGGEDMESGREGEIQDK